MKTLPNGVTIFNATPHEIRFLSPEWNEPVEVQPDELISARPAETHVHTDSETGVEYVRTEFVGNVEGSAIIERLQREYPDVVIVGSIISAQAYPGDVVSMCPAPGYERVPPAEKRMLPDKFNVF